MTEGRLLTLELIGADCPVLPGVTVGVQRASEVVDEHPADGTDARWMVEVRLFPGPDLRGPYVHGRPGARFLYLSWQRAPGGMFRRAKVMLDSVPAALLAAGATGLTGRLALAMPDGSPTCAAIRPPQVAWSAPIVGR